MLKNKIIGIDPDIEKSGVCYLYTPTRQVEEIAKNSPARKGVGEADDL